MPALATTTASIAGLKVLELVKVLKVLKTDQFINVFLNLAVPSMTDSEPGSVQKLKLLENLQSVCGTDGKSRRLKKAP